MKFGVFWVQTMDCNDADSMVSRDDAHMLNETLELTQQWHLPDQLLA
jgi:hypothetical protein